MKTLIIGGGIVGTFLAQILSEKNETAVIDKDPDRCADLAELLPGIKVFNEDGCEPWVLEYAGIADTELVLAVTGDDEDNLVISYLSKFEYDAPKVIARVNNPKNRWLFNNGWGVDVEVSTPDIIAKIIEEEITLGEVVTLIKLQASDIGLVEITVPPDCMILSVPLAEVELPPETLLVTVVRGEAMMIPRADTTLRPGDKVLAITNLQYRDKLTALLGHGS